MPHTLNRREFSLGTLAAAFALAAGSSIILPRIAAAQAVDLTSLGLPELNVTQTATGYEGLEPEIVAGRYLLNVTAGEGVEYAGVEFMSPPAGVSVDELIAGLTSAGGPPEGSPPADAVPGIPLMFYQARFTGGIGGPAGMTHQAIIDFPPGDWLGWTGEPGVDVGPAQLTVTGEMPAELPAVESDITLTMIEFGIHVEGNMTAGDHTIAIRNNGAQPHFVFVSKGPDSMTNEQIGEILMAEMSGEMTPEAMPFNPDTDLMPAFSSMTQSIGTTMWTNATLDAGTYVALCFFPTAGEGLPHAMHGMHTVFQIT